MDFSSINKAHSASFHDQKALIKRLLAGKPCQCKVCKKPLLVHLDDKTQVGKVHCPDGCTEIELELGSR